jgi:uncharacterized membrane protein YphA (DoxX/SURF4 family)
MVFSRRAEKQAEEANEPRWKTLQRKRNAAKTAAKGVVVPRRTLGRPWTEAKKQEESAPAESPLMQIINFAEGGGESLDSISNYEVSEEVQSTATDLGLLLMRLGVAAVMIHHGQEKILDADAFTKYTMDVYFKFLPGSHLYWTYLIGLIQWLAPGGLIFGVGSRLAAGSLTAVMVGAFLQGIIAAGGFEGFPFFELGGLGSKMPFMVPSYHNYGFETPLLYITIFLLLTVSGPGKFSLAERFGFNDDSTLVGKLKQ